MFFQRSALLEELNSQMDSVFHEYTHSLPWISSAAYLAIVFYLPTLLTKVPFFSRGIPNLIRLPLALWNLCLSVLSLLTLLSFLNPDSLSHFAKHGFSDGLCDERYELLSNEHQPVLAFWGSVFTFLKYVELYDTVFLILKDPSRPIPFLHWFHHFTVLVFTWYARLSLFGTGVTFMLINAFVHALMYLYYFLKELHFDLRFAARPITVVQIAQMVAGIFFTAMYVYMVRVMGRRCSCNNPTVITVAAVLIYGSYLLLFVHYFYKRYVLGVERRSAYAAMEQQQQQQRLQQQQQQHKRYIKLE